MAGLRNTKEFIKLVPDSVPFRFIDDTAPTTRAP